ncbi:MAG: hypothetical protein EOP45_06130 [Sphingobacteriaceae bacterium]|nr:MAG: hypothetical protein EOP45_06130 [Sphingobacteriaceae bacterium]
MYRVVKELGRGTYGIIYLIEKTLPNSAVQQFAFKTGGQFDIRKEYAVTKKVSGQPGIIQTFGTKQIPEIDPNVGILLEYNPLNWDLQSYYHAHPITYQKFKSIFTQFIDILEVLKVNEVSHGDIKATNTLYNEETGKIKLIDFGGGCFRGGIDCATVPTFPSPKIESYNNGDRKTRRTWQDILDNDVYGVIFTMKNMAKDLGWRYSGCIRFCRMLLRNYNRMTLNELRFLVEQADLRYDP